MLSVTFNSFSNSIKSNPKNILFNGKNSVPIQSKVHFHKIEMVELRTGTQEPKNLVRAVMILLTGLRNEGQEGISAVYDLTQKCKKSDSIISQKSTKILIKKGLLDQDGSIPDFVKNIVIAASNDNGSDLKLVDPVTAKQYK